MDIDINKIAKKFNIKGILKSFQAYGNGHINNTYILKYEQENNINKYILQRINKTVFKKPEMLMDNITIVTEHIKKQLQKNGETDIARKTLNLIKTNTGKNFFIDEYEDYWRVYDYIRDGETYDNPLDLSVLFEASASFGKFLKLLKNIPQDSIKTIIPDFHSTKSRFSQFQTACKSDTMLRVKTVNEEIDFLINMQERFKNLENIIDANTLPLRITHNDTKINNVIIDKKTKKGLAVIDLDTVMSGFSIFDFGDIVRTSVSACNEDEKNLDKIFADSTRFKAILKGYLSETMGFLQEVELLNLVNGGIIMCSMIGMRFLTDYLNGDIYFKTHYTNHNLDRCRVQFKLANSIIKIEKQLNEIVMEEIR